MELFKKKSEKLLLDQIKNKIKKAEVVSFDIFDTLLVRPYIRPVDLFTHMEKALECPGFENERRDAERRCRIRHKELEDITLDMIYDEIDDEYKHMKQKEMDWEEMVLRANPELKQVYDYAQKLGKKIVIASDMYMPSEFLAKVLRKNGYDGWDKLYVSGEINKSKSYGSMYRQIIKDFNIELSKILHIGDNSRVDIESAELCGLKAVLYERVINQYCKSNRKIDMFQRKLSGNLNASLFLGMMSYRWQEKRCKNNVKYENYWEELGYNIAGPLAYGYSKFIEEEAQKNNINHILFVARDGYTLEKVFKIIHPNIKTSYVYANGSINRLTSLEVQNIDHCNHLINFYSNLSDEIKNLANTTILKTFGDYELFFKRNQKLFIPLSMNFCKNYENYINTIVDKNDNLAIVDSMARTFSSLDLIQKFTQKNILGLYWTYAKTPKADCFNFTTFSHSIAKADTVFDKRNINIFTKNWDIMEFLFTSPEQPIKYISENGVPQYEETTNKFKRYRSTIYPLISEGAVNFAKDYTSFWSKCNCELDFSLLIEWINLFLSFPDKRDLKAFQNVLFFFGDNDDLVRPIFSQTKKTIKLKDFIYKKEVNGINEKIFIFGLPFNTQKMKEGKLIRKKVFGLYKTIKTTEQKKYYLFGIRFKVKEFFQNNIKMNNADIWEIIDTVTEKTQRALTIAFLHKNTFGEYRNANEGKSVVLVGAGPTVSNYEPIKNAIHVGLNRAFLLDKVHFDFLFTIDSGGLDTGIENFHDGFLSYDCIKFIGDQNLGKGYQIPQSVGNGNPTVRRYKTNAGFSRGRLALDIDTEPLMNSVSTSIQAMQFILFTNPKKVYVVGIDCTNSKKEHFIGSAFDNSKRNENVVDNDKKHIQAWKDLRDFVSLYYPETEIIVVNPVGLKGLFKDVYTESYLQKHPEIDVTTVEIIKEEEYIND